MRHLVFALLIVTASGLVPPPVVAQTNETPAIGIRIYDYARLAAESIERAQEQVAGLYAAIGVHTVWARTVRPSQPRVPSHERDPRELLIVILNAGMSRGIAVTDDTLGLSAVTALEGGQVAYVLFDQVRRVALSSGASPADVLGVVIAHEIGHLLLPYGSHSRTGLMRSNWQSVDFRRAGSQHLSFTQAQAASIRERVTYRAK